MEKHGDLNAVLIYKMMKKTVLIFFLFLSVMPKAYASYDMLAYSAQWLALGHYQKSLGNYKASIGSGNFYLSPCGRKNPQKELEATVKLFQSNDYETQCRFPARYKFLKKQGIINAPFPICEEYEQFRKDLQPAGVTLLFTDAYMNNSSSLFGHTLLRIDTARQGTQLLAHGVNYGAYTNGYENSFLYAVYGLTGMYPAGFTTKPYYDVINTYNNIENRDIWEYNLNLSQDELDMLVAHIWEVGQTTTPYYFFSSNCSYMLMEVLDVVKPDLKLSAKFPAHTIPLDTVKAVAEQKGLVKSVNYRPSRQRKIQYRIDQMSGLQYKVFLRTVKNDDYDVSELEDEQRADVLETAYQYVQYQYVAGNLELKEYRQKSFQILKARNQASSGQKFDELKEGKNPTLSHDSAQIAAGIGFYNGEGFQQLSMRPAYHSLTDRPYGFLSGAEINFLNTVFRHYNRSDKYVLQKADILDLASFSPITDIFRAPSYRINVNIEQLLNPHTEKSGYVMNAAVGGGGTVKLTQFLWAYGLSSVEGAYGGFLKNNQWLGVGISGGFLLNTDNFGGQTEIKQVWGSNTIGTHTDYSIVADYYLTRNTAFEASYKLSRRCGKNIDESMLVLKQYF